MGKKITRVLVTMMNNIVMTGDDRDNPSRRRTHNMNVARAMRPETFCAPRSYCDRARGDRGRVGVPGVLAGGGGRVNVLRARVPGLPAPSGRGGGRNGRRRPEGFGGERARERTVDVIAPACVPCHPAVALRLTRLNAHAAATADPLPSTDESPTPSRPRRGSFARSDVLPRWRALRLRGAAL